MVTGISIEQMGDGGKGERLLVGSSPCQMTVTSLWSLAAGGNPPGGFLGTYQNRRPGWAGLRLAPTALLSDVEYNGHRNGFFDNPVSLIFCCISDPNVVGASRREAHPGRRVSRSKADAAASGIRNDERLTMNQKTAGFSGGLFQPIHAADG